MERVTGRGSSSTLRRALFPDGFAGEVMMLISETWQAFSMHHEVRHEEPITALFADALVSAYEQKNWPWFIFPEVPVTDPVYGTQLGRNDLNFFHRNLPQRIFFTVECKRLHVRTSKFVHLADKYVDEGLVRFAEGKYSAGLPCGGMLGYVMDNDMTTAFDRIRKEIIKRCENLKIKGDPSFSQPSRIMKKLVHSADTIHERTDGDFIVHHLLVGVIK